MLLQQLLRLTVRDLTHIPPVLSVSQERLAWLQLPEDCQDVVAVVRRGISEDPLSVTRRINKGGDVQLCVIADVDKPLRWEVERVIFAVVEVRDPAASAVVIGLQDVSEVTVRQDGCNLEFRRGFFDSIPQ